ncbi:YbfB/YjiJ family MFS transporter [Herbaspirillum lusitanum]
MKLPTQNESVRTSSVTSGTPNAQHHAGRALAWQICLSGMLALAAAMGVGRFAFTPLLPMMLHDGTLNLNTAGMLATANYIGYFLGAMLCALHRSKAPITMIKGGLVATVLLTWGMGLLHNDILWISLRLISGMVSAFVFVYSSGWCLHKLTQLGYPELGGVIFCGPGIGIMLTGLSSGPMVAHGWSADSGWLAFGALALLLALMIWRTYRNDPADQDLSPAGASKNKPAGETATVKREVHLQVIAYGMAGFGYIITATFLPVIARQALPDSFWPDFFWPIFGFGVALGAFGATRLSADGDQRRLLTISYLMQAVGVSLSILLPNAFGFALSCLLLGLPFTAITLFAMREARRLRHEHASSLMGLMTASYGLGQIAGPPLATALVHRSGSFSPSLCVAVVALLFGAAMYYRLSRRHPYPISQ